MQSLFGEDEISPAPAPPRPGLTRQPPAARGVLDRSFPTRVAALLRSRPIADTAAGAARQDWPADTYDIATLALAAIELVIAQQGFEDEATYPDVVTGLESLARRAAPHRPAREHARVASYTVDALLNRSARQAPFTYRISDYTPARDTGTGSGQDHQQRQVQFRLLVEREDPARGEVVLNATGDAINALVGGLEFEVEDEQVANEILLERQLARGAFDAAERAAIRARLLSVSLADGLQAVIKETRRDLRSVLDDWTAGVPRALDEARDHIRARIDVEHRLLTRLRELVTSEDADVCALSARIAILLEESRRRHELLHRHVMDARAVFLEEQDRQSFRPPALGYLPDLTTEVFAPALQLPVQSAVALAGAWLSDLGGPRALRVPRLYRLVNDLWAQPAGDSDEVVRDLDDELAGQESPLIRAQAVEAASRAVAVTGLPARLSALIAACLNDPATPDPGDRQQAAEITALAALWCFSPEGREDGDGARADLASQVLGPRAAVDGDDVTLRLPGWDGDDLIVAPYPDALATADPEPVIELTTRTGGRAGRSEPIGAG